jgi:hypothetical protein
MVKDLKAQLSRATQQIKEIAVSVIDSKKTVVLPTKEKNEE